MVGRDQEPIGMSSQENVDAFMKDTGKWSEKMKAGGASAYGYVDIESAKVSHYGEGAA